MYFCCCCSFREELPSDPSLLLIRGRVVRAPGAGTRAPGEAAQVWEHPGGSSTFGDHFGDRKSGQSPLWAPSTDAQLLPALLAAQPQDVTPKLISRCPDSPLKLHLKLRPSGPPRKAPQKQGHAAAFCCQSVFSGPGDRGPRGAHLPSPGPPASFQDT